jgi:hypothetical protein
MTEPMAICPKCQKMVSFVKSTWFATCPECGFQYKLESPNMGPNGSGFVAGLAGVFKALMVVILIMMGLVVVGGAVLFAGCALALGGH